MKIKTIKVVNAYRALKDIKLSNASDDVLLSMWKNINALKPIADKYDNDLKLAEDTLKDDKFNKMQERARQVQEQGNKRIEELSSDERKNIDEINDFFLNHQNKLNKQVEALSEVEVDIDVNYINEKDLLSILIKDNSKTLNDMLNVDFLLKK